jgi:hypothetical protein
VVGEPAEVVRERIVPGSELAEQRAVDDQVGVAADRHGGHSDGVQAGRQAGTCTTLAAAQAGLVAAGGSDASILSVAINKGRDSQFQGAVNGLRLNYKVYDFEADGVHSKGAIGRRRQPRAYGTVPPTWIRSSGPT